MTSRHATWYIKIPLTEDVSLRYYFTFEDRRHLENTWVIKSHADKKYAEISTEACKLIAKAFSEVLGRDVEKDAVEVIGRSVSNKRYRKIEMPVTYENEVSKLPEYIESMILKNDEIIDSCEYIGTQDCEEACNEAIEQAVADSEAAEASDEEAKSELEDNIDAEKIISDPSVILRLMLNAEGENNNVVKKKHYEISGKYGDDVKSYS